jgi:tetrahydromethanopterin S-methyltransferase subunit G
MEQMHEEKQVDDVVVDKNIQKIEKRLEWIEKNIEKIGTWLNQQ